MSLVDIPPEVQAFLSDKLAWTPPFHLSNPQVALRPRAQHGRPMEYLLAERVSPTDPAHVGSRASFRTLRFVLT